jgi:glycosyltransferase involved in cell wall biosynthesis
MKRYTRRALSAAGALHADCQRDLRLAREWGFDPSKPGVVLPGAGGIQLDLFYPPEPDDPQRGLRVINPRGIRTYVCNEAFFQAIPHVLGERPDTQFICPVMAGEPQAERWVAELGLGDNVQLLPRQTRAQMAELFRSARLVVSPSEHDGTPNTLLEAMACGCLPLAGDIESIREWITPGSNGLLFDPADPQALAETILLGLRSDDLHDRAREANRKIIVERAAYQTVMKSAAEFYQSLV